MSHESRPFAEVCEEALLGALPLVTDAIDDPERAVKEKNRLRVTETKIRVVLAAIKSGVPSKPPVDMGAVVEAFGALLACHDEDIGMDEYGDDESVGAESGPDPSDPIVDMKLTFGVLRRARKALAAIKGGVL